MKINTSVVAGTATILLGTAVGLVAILRGPSELGNGDGPDRPSWVEGDVVVNGKSIPMQYQKCKVPIEVKVVHGKKSPKDTAVATVISSITCIPSGGTFDEWADHYIDPKSAKKVIPQNMTVEEWLQDTRKTKWDATILGQIRYSKFVIVVAKMRIGGPASRWFYVGVPTVARNGKYYRDSRAAKSLDPVMMWLSANEYPMVTGVNNED